MPNVVHSSQLIRNVITKKGKSVAVSYATRTDTWNRAFLAQSVQEQFAKSIEETAEVPAGAVNAVLAETEHKSDSDQRSHFTTVWEDKNGNHVTTKHVTNKA